MDRKCLELVEFLPYQCTGEVGVASALGLFIWGCSSVGRASEWHSEGRGFETHLLHHILKLRSIFMPKQTFDDFTTQIQSDELAEIINYNDQFEDPRYQDEE